ncbi:MAG: indolepyruvate oxidoreductase subunit beta [bacterium]|nr:indolepyruvate oxidoreductase subunit beta [bacterium]
MKKNYNILIAGVGGQGIILTSDILSHAALLSGFDVKKSEIHGMSQRGGNVFSFIRYGEKIYSPIIPMEEADILISFEQMEVLRWLDYTHKDTTIIYSDIRILPASVILGREKYPDDIEEILCSSFSRVIKVEKENILHKIKSIKYLNTLMLGIASLDLNIKDQVWEESVKHQVPERTLKDNMDAFMSGKEYLK